MTDDLLARVQATLSRASDAVASQLNNLELTERQRQEVFRVYQALRDLQVKFLNMPPGELSDADRSQLQESVTKIEQTDRELQSANLAGGPAGVADAISRYRDALGRLFSVGTHGSGDGEP